MNGPDVSTEAGDLQLQDLDAASKADAGERVLNQDEIDVLLGFDIGPQIYERTGIAAIINSALVSYERLPLRPRP